MSTPARTLKFTKMNGAGNDFVMVDNRDLSFQPTQELLAKLCDRHRGVGADGVLLVEPSQHTAALTDKQLDKELADTFPASDPPSHTQEPAIAADYRMRYYNADGGEVEMCGNGARCFARFVQKLETAGGAAARGSVSFETIAGVIGAEYEGDLVRLRMSTPHGLALGAALPIETEPESLEVHFLNTGVPHAVVFAPKVEAYPVHAHGAALRYHPHFAPAGTNANFVQVEGRCNLRLRTYERGVEGETLACGTGVVASALLHSVLTGAESPVSVRVQGGDTLRVEFKKHGEGAGTVFTEVDLIGPADFVFDGELAL
jgi:diaminopimelate epimerase